jgi:hypothetical protein
MGCKGQKGASLAFFIGNWYNRHCEKIAYCEGNLQESLMKRTLKCLILFLAAGSIANAVFVDPSDTNIQYMGRWNFSDPSLPEAAWQGTAITVNFEGTGIKATIDGGSASTHPESMRVVIDDDYSTTYTFEAEGGVKEYTLASGLLEGVHKLVLMKETYWWYKTVFHGFDVTGAGLVTPPARPALKMECFGDSNAAGDNIATEDNSSGTGQYFSFPFIAARALGAEMHNLSTSGETISGSHDKYDRYEWTGENPQWDFSLYTPDIVIMELGANDVVAGTSQEDIVDDYNAFLDDLRATYPDAHICLLNGYGWDFNETANYTADVVAARGDLNMSYVHHPWVFGQWHGCENEHAGMARFLVEHLENELGITAPNEIDVMDGFGRDGNVANGSFEEVAPFGGFGWRYFLDPGVSRIHDPSGAYDGDYYLRLSDGAKSFQTNPAKSGETFTVTAWMRGGSGGEQADITIDFRDQSMGGYDISPMIAYTETKTLTGGWEQYSMTATAPTDMNPVFGTRTTFRAGSGDTVEIDYVRMSCPAYSYCGDGACDFADLLVMAMNWLSNDPVADFSGDAIINVVDFSILAERWVTGGN